MKYIGIILLALLSGCAQLINGQIQPVILKDASNKIYYTNCGGAAEGWGSCYSKAQKTCPNGYSVVDKYDDPNGIKLEYTFRCK